MSDPVENNLARGRFCALDRVLFGTAVEHNVLLWNFSDPTTVDFAVELDCELHNDSLTPARFRSGGVRLLGDSSRRSGIRGPLAWAWRIGGGFEE